MEQRRVLATFTVTDLGDAGAGTLREAVAQANDTAGQDFIAFDPALDGQTIALTTGQISITDSLVMDATSLNLLRIDASGSDMTPDTNDGLGSRIFVIQTASESSNSVDIEVSLSGITFVGGDVDGMGGAILSLGQLTISDSQFMGNHAANHGGAVALIFSGQSTGSAAISNSTFAENTAGVDGGGVFLASSGNFAAEFSVVASTFRQNTAGADGGGFASTSSGSLTIEQSRFDRNVATGTGGGILIDQASDGSATVLIGQSVMERNSAASAGGLSLSVSNSVAEIWDSTISENLAFGNGGGISAVAFNSGVVRLINSTISGNSTTGSAAGARLATLNQGGYGTAAVYSSTIVANESDVDGDGDGAGAGLVFVDDGADGHLRRVDHSIVANNFHRSPAETTFDDVEGAFQASQSLIETNATAAEISGQGLIFDTDPMLGPLAENFGPTRTHLPLAGSPVIDAGELVSPLGLTADQRGLARLFDGNGDGNADLDSGAVEVQPLPNVDPMADAGMDVSAAIGRTVSLNGANSSDPDGGPTPLTFTWEVLSGPGNTTLSDAAAVVTDFTADTEGTYEVQLTVSDGEGTSTDIVRVEVFINQVPFANADADRVRQFVGRPIQLDASASVDPDSDSLGYAWSVMEQPANSSPILAAPTAASTTLNVDRAGAYRIQLVVNDGLEDSRAFSFTVNYDDAPRTSGGPYVVYTGDVLQLNGFAPEGSDPIAFNWDLDNDGQFNDASGAATAVPFVMLQSLLGADPEGVFPIALQIAEADGNLITEATTLTIRPLVTTSPLTDGSATTGVALGDLDGDGDADAFVTRFSDDGDTMSILFNDGHGMFTTGTAAVPNVTSGGTPQLADFDGDGDLDTYVSAPTFLPALMLNDGTGVFTAAGGGSLRTGLGYVGDINGDGSPDVIQVGGEDQTAEGWLNNGAGVFESSGKLLPGVSGIQAVGLVDADGDDDLDAFVVLIDGPSQLWLNDGTGIFVDSGQRLAGTAGGRVLFSDLDGDGDQDAVIFSEDESSTAHGIVLLNDGDGAFFASDQSISAEVTTGLAFGLADISGDGVVDIVASGGGGPLLFSNQGLGTFPTPLALNGSAGINEIAFSDVDGDGDIDAYFAVQTGSDAIWLNRTATQGWHNSALDVDVDHNSVLGPLDALLVINELTQRNFSTTSGVLASPLDPTPLFLDVNNDGFIGPLDAQLVINQLPSTSGDGSGSRPSAALHAVAGIARFDLDVLKEDAKENDAARRIDRALEIWDSFSPW